MSWLLYLAYLFAATGLGLYSLNYLVIVLAYFLNRRETLTLPPLLDWPHVTIQLPVYDEMHVVERLISSVGAIEWPRDRLHVQVLDDSDDETTSIAQAQVHHLQKHGIDIELIHRQDRKGFKAGALAEGLKRAQGNFIAIFDADFVPPPNFLKQTIPYFATRPELGMVQARWGHLNANFSALTRAEEIALDGHFAIEQSARSRSDLFMNFNGSAGVWRRECIEQSGGWHEDTLTEDLDLSYRAQLGGWKFRFLPGVVAPAEVPPQINAFKRQQFRWAKGSTQCLVKLAPRVLGAGGQSLFKRFEGLVHLSGYLMNPLMLVLLLTLVPLIYLGIQFPTALMFLSLASFGPVTLYALSQRELYQDWRARMQYFPVLVLAGVGLAVNNSLAVLQAFARYQNAFHRTPKFRVETAADRWDGKRYTLPLDWIVIGEMAFAVYAFGGVAIAWTHHSIWAIPILLMFAGGLGYTSALTLWHSRTAVLRPRPSLAPE